MKRFHVREDGVSNKRRNSGKRTNSGRYRKRRRVLLEQLEKRQLLAADGSSSENNAPTVVDETFELAAEQSIRLYTSDLNYEDVDDDPLKHLSVVEAPEHGILQMYGETITVGQTVLAGSLDFGDVSYHADDDAEKDYVDTFKFHVSDGKADSEVATFTFDVDVLETNPPVPSNHTVELAHTHHAVLTFADFPHQRDGSFEHVSIVELPQQGTLTLFDEPVVQAQNLDSWALQSQHLIYRPDVGVTESYLDELSFTVTDSFGESEKATLSFDVSVASNTPPTATVRVLITPLTQPHAIGLSDIGYDDADGDAMSHLTLRSLPSGGGSLHAYGSALEVGDTVDTATISYGELKYIPVADATEAYSDVFTYTVSDGEDDSETTTMILRVGASENTPPVIIDRTLHFGADDFQANIYTSDFQYVDAEGDRLDAIVVDTLPTAGTLTLAGTPLAVGQEIDRWSLDSGRLQYLPDESTQDAYQTTFVARASDGDKFSLPATMTIAVSAADQADLPNGTIVVESLTNPVSISDQDLNLPMTADEHFAVTVSTLPELGILRLAGVPVAATEQIDFWSLKYGEFTYQADVNATETHATSFDYAYPSDDGITITDTLNIQVKLDAQGSGLAGIDTVNFELADESTHGSSPESGFVVLRVFGKANDSTERIEIDFNHDGFADEIVLADSQGQYQAFGIVPASGIAEVGLRVTEDQQWTYVPVNVDWPGASVDSLTLVAALTIQHDVNGNSQFDRLKLSGHVLGGKAGETLDLDVDYERDHNTDDVFFIDGGEPFSILLTPGVVPDSLQARLTIFDANNGIRESSHWKFLLVDHGDSDSDGSSAGNDGNSYAGDDDPYGSGNSDGGQGYDDDSDSDDDDSPQNDFTYGLSELTNWPSPPVVHDPKLDVLPSVPEGLELITEVGDAPDVPIPDAIQKKLDEASQLRTDSSKASNETYRSAVDEFKEQRDARHAEIAAKYQLAIAAATAEYNKAIDDFAEADLSAYGDAVQKAQAEFVAKKAEVEELAQEKYTKKANEIAQKQQDEEKVARDAHEQKSAAESEAFMNATSQLFDQMFALNERLMQGDITQSEYDSQMAQLNAQMEENQNAHNKEMADIDQERDVKLIEIDRTATIAAADAQQVYSQALAGAAKQEYGLLLEAIENSDVATQANRFNVLLNTTAAVEGKAIAMADADQQRLTDVSEADRDFANHVADAERDRAKRSHALEESYTVTVATLHAQAAKEAEGDDASANATLRRVAAEKNKVLDIELAKQQRIKDDKIAEAEHELTVAINGEVHTRKSAVHSADRSQKEDLAKASRNFKDKFLEQRKTDSADTAGFHRVAQEHIDTAERQWDVDQASFQNTRTGKLATGLEGNRKEQAALQNQYEYNQISKAQYDEEMARLTTENQEIRQAINAEVFADPSDILSPDSSSGDQGGGGNGEEENGGESHAKHGHRSSVSNAYLKRANQGSEQTTAFASSNSLWTQNLEKDNFAARGKRADSIIGARLACEGNIAAEMVNWMTKVNAADTAYVEATLIARATHAADMAAAMGAFQLAVTSQYAAETAEFANANPDNPWAAAANRQANAAVTRAQGVTEAYVQLVDTISTAEAVASTGTIAAYGDYRIAETNIAVTFHRQRADAEKVYANQLIAADQIFVDNVSLATTVHDDDVAHATGEHHKTKSAAQTKRWQEMYAANLIRLYKAYLGIPSNQINTTSDEIDVAGRYIDVVVPADKALQDALSEASKTLHKTMASETETQIKSKAAAGLTLAESLADSLFTFDTSLATRYEQLQTTLANISYVFATGWIGADAAFSKAVNEADRVLAHATSENQKTLEIDIAERERQAVITWANEDGYVTLDEQYSIDMHAAEVDWITNTATLSTGYETFAADEYKKLSDKLVDAQQTAAVQGEDALKNHRHNMASKVRAKAESVSQALTTEAKDSAKAATTLITDTAAANRTFAESVADAVHTYKTGVAYKQASAEAGLKGDKESEHSDEINAATYESRKALKEQQLQLALSQLIVKRAGEFAKATDTWGEEFTRAGEQNTVDQSKVVKQRVNSVLDAGISYLTGMNAENSTLRIAYRTADEAYVVSAAEAEQQNVTNTGAAWTSLISDRGAENVAWAEETAGYEVDYVIASAQNDAQKKRSEAGDSPTRAERFQIRVADSRIDYLQSVSGAFVTYEVSAAENASKQDAADAEAAEKLDNDIGSAHLTYVRAASSQYLARYTAASGHGVTYGNALANQYGAHIVTDAGAHHTAVITAASGVRSGGYEFAKADANYYSETAKYAHLSLNHVYGSEGSTSPSKDYLEDYNTAVANATYTAQSARVNAAATRTTTVLQADLDYALGVADLDHDYTIGIAAEQKALAVFNAGAAQTLSHGVADAFESHDLSQARAAHDRIIEDAEALETALMKQYTEAKQVYHTFDDVLDVEVQYAIGVVDGNLAWAEVAGPAFIAHQTAIADANLSYVETVSGHATLARKSMADAEKTYGVSQATTNYDATVASSEAGKSVKVQLAAASFILHTQRNSADSALKLAQLGLQRDAKIDAGWGNDPVIDADKLQQARDAATQKKSSASGSHDAKLAELRQSYHQSTTEIYRDSGKAQADHGLVIDLAMAGIAKSYDDALNDASRDHRKAVIDADQDHAIAAIDAEIAGLWGRAHSFHSDANTLAANTAQNNRPAKVSELNADRVAQKELAEKAHASAGSEIAKAHSDQVTEVTDYHTEHHNQFDLIYAQTLIAGPSGLQLPSVVSPDGISWSVSAGSHLSGAPGSIVESLLEAFSYGQNTEDTLSAGLGSVVEPAFATLADDAYTFAASTLTTVGNTIHSIWKEHVEEWVVSGYENLAYGLEWSWNVGTAAGLGLLQGGANLVNGVQDAVLGIVNLVIMIPNSVAYLLYSGTGVEESQQLYISYIDTEALGWSRGLFCEESDATHSWSKFLGGEGIMMLCSGGLTKAATAVDDAGRCATWIARFVRGKCFVADVMVVMGSDVARDVVADSDDVSDNPPPQVLAGLFTRDQSLVIGGVLFVGAFAVQSMRDRKRQQSLTPHLDYYPEGRNDDDESDNQEHGLRDDQSTTDRPPSDDVLGTALSELIAECPVSPIPTLRTSPPPEDTVTNVHSERSRPDTSTEVGCPRSTVAHTAAVDVPTKPSSLVKNFSVALAVTLLFFLSLVGLRGTSPPNDGPVAGSLSAASLEGSSFESPAAGFVSPSRLKPIQQVELGDRVETGLTAAQLAAAVDDPASAPWWDQLDADVDADTWRQINLVVTNDQGSRSEVDLLRPVSWLSAHQANVGGRIYLSMPEMGVEGYGEVISIGNSPEIASGPGCVVTGRFRHVSDDVLSVRLSDQPAALGVTAQHPVYSLDRGDFVAAGELSAGERLATLAGPTAVLGIQPQHTAQTVYNLEVQGQHVFRVTSNGLLVHNSYADDIAKLATDLYQQIRPGTKGWKEAVEQISRIDKGKVNVRVRSAKEAKQLLKESRGKMNRYKQYTRDGRGPHRNYRKGYEVHNEQNLKEITVGNNLPHIKWFDGKSSGHIFYDIPN